LCRSLSVAHPNGHGLYRSHVIYECIVDEQIPCLAANRNFG
jgi:hypothetical protein